MNEYEYNMEKAKELCLIYREDTIKAEATAANCLRIMRERANAIRGITPKKAHDGYLVLSSRQWLEYYDEMTPETGYEGRDREWLEKNRKLKTQHKKEVAWKSVLQTPYSTGMMLQLIQSEIEKDLLQKHVLQDIGCFKHVDWKENGTYRELRLENGEKANTLYRWLYHANFRTGLWEVEIYTTQSLVVPDYRRPSIRYS